MPRLDLAMPGKSIAENCELARLAESRGFGGAWVSETAGSDAVTQAAAIGAALHANRLGTAIVPIQTRDPLLMAMTAHSLQSHLDGRFVLGLGTSTRVIIEDWHSRPWGSPISGMRDYVSLLRRFLAGEKVTFEGSGWKYSRASLSSSNPRQAPIHLAALNERMLRLAAEVGDGVILNFGSLEYVRWAMQVLSSARVEAGRDGPFEVMMFLRSSVTDDPESVLRRYQQEFLTYLLSPVYQVMFSREGQADLCNSTEEKWAQGERALALESIPMDFCRDRALIGTQAEIHTRVADYFEAGIDTIILLPVPNPAHNHHDACVEVIETLAPTAGGPAVPVLH